MAAKADQTEPRERNWQDAHKAASSRAREAASRGRQLDKDGRRKGQEAAGAAGATGDTAANPLKSILSIFGIEARGHTPSTVATPSNLALVTEIPRIGAREPKHPKWGNPHDEARSRAREAATRVRAKGEEGRKQGEDAARSAQTVAAVDSPRTRVAVEPSTLATSTVTSAVTTRNHVLISTAPQLEAGEPNWRDALNAALSKASDAAARGREKGAEGRRKGVEADLEAAERERDQAMEKSRRSLTAIIHGWRDDISSAKSLESSYRSYASSILASAGAEASGKNNTRDKTTTRARAGPLSPPASLPSNVRANSAEVLSPFTLGESLAGVRVIAGAFGIL